MLNQWFRGVGVVAVLIFLVGCVTESQPTATIPQPEEAPRGPIRVACVGESITYGAGIMDRENQSYPAVLQRLLGNGYDVRNYGVSGATVLKAGDRPYWRRPELKEAIQFNPQIVILMMGTNDSKPQNWQYGYGFESDYLALVSLFGSLPIRPIVLLATPPPVHEPQYGINDSAVSRVMAHNIRRFSRQMRLPLLDLNRDLRGRPELFADGVHPNAQGAEEIAIAASKVLTQFRKR